ncbi:MAG: hypothetical protein DWQ36_22370 [Acidobacteria bacterium]|nr:MAG: hypothetical protein DWQ30_06690 [Acidobacteriota bacterium]REK00583.1 MAG: hypothetical protein DWQ36_22370 [Acidobacteriota bacterium]
MALLKLFAIAAASALAALGVGTLTIVGYLFTGGVASVQVENPDTDLYIPVPLRLVDLAFGVADWAAPEQELEQAREELGEYAPLLRDLAREIGDIPEGELLRVQDPHQQVVIAQRRGHFHIQVDAPDNHVRVTVPRRAAERLIDKSVRLLGE